MPQILSEDELELLKALKAARLELISGRAQSYRIGSRSVTYIDLGWINQQIKELEGTSAPKIRRIVPMD